jgi:hypothetical protein
LLDECIGLLPPTKTQSTDCQSPEIGISDGGAPLTYTRFEGGSYFGQITTLFGEPCGEFVLVEPEDVYILHDTHAMESQELREFHSRYKNDTAWFDVFVGRLRK